MATTALFLLGKSNGQRSQEGYSQWGHKEWDTTEHSAAAACTELGDVGQMSPTSRLRTRTSCHISGSFRLEIKCAINSMCLNRAETILPNPGPWKNYLSRNRSQGSNSWGPLYKGIVLLPFRTKIHSLNFRELQMTYRCVPL